MSDIAVKVENLGKLYRLGAQQVRHNSLRDALVFGFKRLASKRNSVEGEQNLWALKDVSFEVKHGEVVGIIGRNGAGKSTLLKVLAHITEPTTGRVSIYGRVGSLLEVGTGFHPELTGRDNIYMNGAILGMKRAEIQRKFDEIVAFAEIEKFLDTPVKRYSSGMYVRLAFAVAANLETEILLVDEVLAVGDVQFQKKCLGKMGDVAKDEGRTVLFVSHNMAAIQSMTTKSIVLDHGKIKFIGETDQAIQEYTTTIGDVGLIPLDERMDRTGSKPKTIRNIRVLSNEKPIDTAVTGLPLEIELDYSEPSGDLEFFIAFYDVFERRIVHINTIMSGLRGELTKGMGTVRCTIPRLPLSPGVYHIAVAVDRKGETLDRIEHAYDLNVNMGDFYNTGRTTGSGWGMVLVENYWEAR